MSHRPYPNVDRALKQIDRHIDEVGPIRDENARPLSPFEAKLFEGATAAVQTVGASLATSLSKMRRSQPGDAPPVDEYRLSTR